MSEDVELNSTLGTIEAVDLDRGDNGDIKFQIASGDTNRFSLVMMQLDSMQTHVAMLINNEVGIGFSHASKLSGVPSVATYICTYHMQHVLLLPHVACALLCEE